MARPAARKKAAPKAASKGATVTQMLTTPGSGGRRAFVSRATKETRIAAAINLDGTGKYDIKTGIGFLDHMLEQLSRHSLIDITLRAEGDLHIDYHHTTEDSGIVLGECLDQGAGRPRRHPPLWRGPHPDGRDADRGGARCLQPALPDLEGRPSPSPSSAPWTPSCSRSGSRPSPSSAG